MKSNLSSGGHSSFKVTGMCLAENENRGYSVKDFLEKRGSLGVGSPQIGPFIGVPNLI